jgi:hypothetical protein
MQNGVSPTVRIKSFEYGHSWNHIGKMPGRRETSIDLPIDAGPALVRSQDQPVLLDDEQLNDSGHGFFTFE